MLRAPPLQIGRGVAWLLWGPQQHEALQHGQMGCDLREWAQDQERGRARDAPEGAGWAVVPVHLGADPTEHQRLQCLFGVGGPQGDLDQEGRRAPDVDVEVVRQALAQEPPQRLCETARVAALPGVPGLLEQRCG